MAYRYSVLWEPTERGARPVGLAVEQDTFVLVEARSECGHFPVSSGARLVTGPMTPSWRLFRRRTDSHVQAHS